MARKRKKHEEHENHERWLVSYADFITLLFAFFVVMYATSNADTEKQKDFEDSVRVNLKLGMMGSGPGAGKADGSPEAALLELSMPLGNFPQKGGAVEAQDYVERYIDKNLGADEKKKAIQEIHHDSIGVRISLAAEAFFPPGSAKLKRSSLDVLNRVAEMLKKTDRRVIIEGHTDDQQIANSEFASNWELASQRATSVVRYFIKYQKMDPKRFAAISYADQKPVAPNDNEENRAKNRRIEILIVTDKNVDL